jgi:CBS domain-containing protein
MKARDIMTSPVITVSPQTAVREVAALLLERRISGMPVVEEDKVVGIVSECDLLHRHEIGTDMPAPGGSWWLRLFSAEESPSDYIRAYATKAGDIMTREVVKVAEDAPVARIAMLLHDRGIRRVPVMRGDRLVGIVSRANLVRALASQSRPQRTSRAGDDEAIRRALVTQLQRHPWWRALYSKVVVLEGVVHFYGLINTQAEKDAARVAAENVLGVRRIVDHRLSFYDSHSMI